MAIKGIEQTFIYSHLNKSNALTSNISNLLTKGEKLTEDQLQEPLTIINKNFKFPLKYRVIEDFKNGGLVVMYGKGSKLPTCMPFFLTKINGHVTGVISADIYGTLDESNNAFKIDPKKLYCMMEGAYIAKIIYNNNIKVSQSPVIIGKGSEIYSAMFTRVLNKKYALNVDKTKMHKILLLSSKFFMINILGAPNNDIAFNYAIKNCPNANMFIMNETNSMFDASNFESFDKFIAGLMNTKELGLGFKDLSVRGYLEAFINMYESSALLSLESMYYFAYNILCVLNGGYINNQYVLEDMVGSSGANIYNTIAQMSN